MRNVYLDPFGTYTSAFDKGMARQMDLESNARQARATDFDYNYMAPLRYSDAQLANRYNQASLPYRIRDLGYGERATRGNLYNLENTIGQGISRDTGMVQPALQALSQYIPGLGYEYEPQSGMIDFTQGGEQVGRTTDAALRARYMQPENIAEQDRQMRYATQDWEQMYKIQEMLRAIRYQDMFAPGAAGTAGGSGY